MKKFLLVALIFAFLCTSANAQMLQGIVSGTKAGTCTLYKNGDQTPDAALWPGVGSTTDIFYGGQAAWSPDSGTVQICKIDVSLRAHGTITGHTYTLRLWSGSGTGPLGTALASSSPVTGNNSWNNTYVSFNISLSATSGTNYYIALEQDAVDANNFVYVGYGDTEKLVGIGSYAWKQDKSYGGNNGGDSLMKIYTMQ